MQFSNSVLFSVVAALSAVVSAAPVDSFHPPQLSFQVVRYDSLANNSTVSAIARRHRKIRTASDSGINLPLKNEYSLYLADITIGTPAQKIQVDVDTGSSDLWVPGAGTQSSQGTYDNSKSSTYQKVKSGFQIGYGDGSSASGDWAKETVNIGGSDVTGLEFGDATTQNVGQSILGVGFTGNEASAQAASPFTYDNLPIQLKKQGIIPKSAYSLYLNGLDATTGSILFGAIDEAKFTAPLKTLSIQNVDDSGSNTDSPVAFFVNLDGISDGSNTFTSSSYPALLDSGTTLIYAPSDVATAVGKAYGTYDQQAGGYTTSCDTTGPDFSFTFEDKTITVPFKDLLFNTQGTPGASGTCLVGVLDSQSSYYILGDGFLRSAYVYYNLDDAEIGIAQAVYTDKTSIVPAN